MPDAKDTVTTCDVYGYSIGVDSAIDQSVVTAKLIYSGVQYSDNVIVTTCEATATPDGDGLWTLTLVETASMKDSAYYLITVAGRTYKKKVPAQAEAALWDLEDAT